MNISRIYICPRQSRKWTGGRKR